MSFLEKFSARRTTKRSQLKRLTRATRLGLESLESRVVLASGVVDLDTLTTPGSLFIDGDTSNNDVEIRQTLNVNEFTVTGKNGTLLSLNQGGAANPQTFPTLTVNGIVNDITVDLNFHAVVGGGVDSFSFVAGQAGASNVPNDLNIQNSAGSNTNIISDVIINNDLNVTAVADGYKELHILNTEITGSAVVDNTNGGFNGDTKTVIDSSKLRAGVAPASALIVTNGIGMDDLSVRGNSQFGDGAPKPLFNDIVDINNGDGPAMTVFTGASRVYGPGTTTVYGDLSITNGMNRLGTMDVATFNQVNVFGDVMVTNGEGNTETMVIGSELFSDLLPVNQGPPGSPEGPAGAGVVIVNDRGFDVFESVDSDMPWGLWIDNDFAAVGTSTSGSRTDIRNSRINTARGIGGPSGLTVLGDNGADVVNIDPTVIRGIVDLHLGNGQNEAVLGNDSVVDQFRYRGGHGVDKVLIDNAQVTSLIDIDLLDGADLMSVVNVDPLADLPSAVGDIDIDGGNNPGDTLDTDFGPLLGSITGFDFFT